MAGWLRAHIAESVRGVVCFAKLAVVAGGMRIGAMLAGHWEDRVLRTGPGPGEVQADLQAAVEEIFAVQKPAAGATWN